MIRRALLLILVAIPACAVFTNADGWEARPDVAPLKAVFVDTDAAQIQRLCPPKAGYVTHGCAVRRYDLNLCFIYAEPDVPGWLATHELAHCAGFNHG